MPAEVDGVQCSPHCAGRYRFEDNPGNPVLITAKNGGLTFADVKNQPPLVCAPVSALDYQLVGTLKQLRFVRGASSTVESVQIMDRGVVTDTGVRLKDKPVRRR